MKLAGTVVAAHGREYVVAGDDGRRLRCVPRGKRSECACGDRVEVSVSSPEQGRIETISPRRNLLFRSNEFRRKLIAANLSRIVVVVATEPPFSEEVLSRCLIAAEDQGIEPLIVLNKVDLPAGLAEAERRLATYAAIGYRVLRLSARGEVGELRLALAGQTSVLVGQSGMGKSTLINNLIPGANTATREISEALRAGKHTTTHATLYALDGGESPRRDEWLIDSPGLQEFGLEHLDFPALEQAMPELRQRAGLCRFRDCRHDREPGCVVREAVAAGDIAAVRYAVFRSLASGV